VLSNLTVSVGSLVSFDGAGICVAPGSSQVENDARGAGEG